MDSKLASGMADLEQLFSSQMQDYEDKLKQATTDPKPAHSDIASLTREFSQFKSFIWQAFSKLKVQMELLALGFDRHETVMRSKVLLIHGVTEKPEEKLDVTVQKLLTDQIKLMDKNTIHVCHRLGSNQGKTRPILVRLFKMEHRQIVWESKKLLKGTGITISEFLTQSRHRVFIGARKHFGLHNCWTTEGKIVVITADKTRRKIESQSELQELISKFPSSVGDSESTVSSKVLESPKGTSTSPAAEKGQRRTRRRN